jgi:hypothetical protein
MKNILAGFGNSVIWPFARNAFSDDFKVASIVCGGSNEHCCNSMISGLGNTISGTSRQLCGKESDPRRGSSISKDSTQCKPKWYTDEGKIKNNDSNT